MTTRAFVAGPVSWNTLVLLDRLPESRPHMVRARDHRQALGGTSAGKALNLAGLGCDVTLRTLVGDDDAAASIRRHLDVPGLELLAEVGDSPSEQHLNLMTGAGERLSIYLDLPELAVEQHAGTAREALRRCDVALIDLAEHSRPLLAEARALGKPVWCDLHDYDGRSAFHQDWVDAADVLFLNDDAMSDPLPFMRSRVQAGVEVAVCTQGAMGATAVTSERELHVPAHRVDDVVDTNGAGDAFLSGFLVSRLAGAGLAESLEAGHAQAARTLRSPTLAPPPDGG
jgi:sugar/nucleoside kinase (ribokinase family)